MIFQTIDTAVQRFEEIIIQNQDGLSLYSAEKVHVGTDDKPSEQEEFSLELQKELFENSDHGGNMSGRGPQGFDGEMKIRQNLSKAQNINVVIENAILEGFGIEPKEKIQIVRQPLVMSFHVLSHNIEADHPKDLSHLTGPRREFENIQLDSMKNISNLVVGRI